MFSLCSLPEIIYNIYIILYIYMKSESEVAQSCPTLCDPMDCSTPGLPVHHQFPEPTQTQICLCARWRQWHPTPVLLPGKSHGWRSLVGCSSWGLEESDTTDQLHSHFSLLYIGEGIGNPLQCSCLENPRDSRAWWAAIYGVAQNRTQMKRLSSSNSSSVLT